MLWIAIAQSVILLCIVVSPFLISQLYAPLSIHPLSLDYIIKKHATNLNT